MSLIILALDSRPSTHLFLPWLAVKDDAECLVALGERIAVDRAELVLQRGCGGEAIGDRVRVGERLDIDRLDRRDPDVSDAGDITALARSHVAEFPEADRLGFLAGANGGQEFLFEEEHVNY
jgi:hypothetical protein